MGDADDASMTRLDHVTFPSQLQFQRLRADMAKTTHDSATRRSYFDENHLP
jgi:hypothetical protein